MGALKGNNTRLKRLNLFSRLYRQDSGPISVRHPPPCLQAADKFTQSIARRSEYKPESQELRTFRLPYDILTKLYSEFPLKYKASRMCIAPNIFVFSVIKRACRSFATLFFVRKTTDFMVFLLFDMFSCFFMSQTNLTLSCVTRMNTSSLLHSSLVCRTWSMLLKNNNNNQNIN